MQQCYSTVTTLAGDNFQAVQIGCTLTYIRSLFKLKLGKLDFFDISPLFSSWNWANLICNEATSKMRKSNGIDVVEARVCFKNFKDSAPWWNLHMTWIKPQEFERFSFSDENENCWLLVAHEGGLFAVSASNTLIQNLISHKPTFLSNFTKTDEKNM